jgi:hypothetical protein
VVTFEEFAAALSLDVSHDGRRGRGAVHRARRAGAAQRVRIDAGDLEKQLALAVTRAVVAVTAAEHRHALAVRTIGLAEQALTAEQARLASGKSRNVDVLARQDELRAAQLRQVRAIVEWHRAATTIAALTGELLPELTASAGAPPPPTIARQRRQQHGDVLPAAAGVGEPLPTWGLSRRQHRHQRAGAPAPRSTQGSRGRRSTSA